MSENQRRVRVEIDLRERLDVNVVYGPCRDLLLVISSCENSEISFSLEEFEWQEGRKVWWELYRSTWYVQNPRNYPPGVNVKWVIDAVKSFPEVSGSMCNDLGWSLFYELELMPSMTEKDGWIQRHAPQYWARHREFLDRQEADIVSKIMNS